MEAEGFNVEKTNFTEFMQNLEGKLALISGAGGMSPIDSPDSEFYGSDEVNLETVRRPLIVLGLPGIGKTCCITSIIKKLNKTLPPERQIGFKKTLLGQTVVGTMEGIPVVNPETGETVRVQVPDLPDAKRDGEYGVYFLDEITTADSAQVQPALGLCDDSRSIGEYTLPEHWVVVAAGNGDDCANFVELHDMTLSRFEVYDISYDYIKDWKPWALKNGINEMIIAFLNFDPSACVRVESSEMHKAAKLFPCPRTWTRLSNELAIRKAQGREVKDSELMHFASRIVGTRAAREFEAFCMFKKDVRWDAKRIAEGTEAMPTNCNNQVFHIILEQCMKFLNTNVKWTKPDCSDVTDEMIDWIGNVMKWFIGFEKFNIDNTVNAVMEITRMGKFDVVINSNPRFRKKYREYDDFIDRHIEVLMKADYS